MNGALQPTPDTITGVFSEEMIALGGRISDQFKRGGRLFLRGILPFDFEVRRGDVMHTGVALRCAGTEILVHPYLFREVCRNGAIRAHATQTRRIERVDDDVPAEVDQASERLRQTIRSCTAPDAWNEGINEVGAAAEIDADHLIMLMPALARGGDTMSLHLLNILLGRAGDDPRSSMPEPMTTGMRSGRGVGARALAIGLEGLHARLLLRNIRARYEREGDRTLFGLMNAVTSAARDSRDEETRWRLESLGGGVPAMLKPRPDPAPARARRESARAPIAV